MNSETSYGLSLRITRLCWRNINCQFPSAKHYAANKCLCRRETYALWAIASHVCAWALQEHHKSLLACTLLGRITTRRVYTPRQMKPLIRFCRATIAIWLGLPPLLATAEPIIFPTGLRIDPPADVDVTYQVVPSYDDKENVIAVWNGEKLQFFITQEKLPPGHEEAKSYLSLLVADLRKAWGGIELGRQVAIPSANGVTLTTVELSKPAKAGSLPSTLFMTHVVARDSAYMLQAVVVPTAMPDEVYAKLVKLLRAVSFDTIASAPEAASLTEESPLVGTWESEAVTPQGLPSRVFVDLKPDRSFETKVTVSGKEIFSGSGAWSLNGTELNWVYIHTRPELPAARREDADKLVAIEGDSFVVRSLQSGEQRVFKRAAQH